METTNILKLYSLKDYIFLVDEMRKKSLIIRRNPLKIFEKPIDHILPKLEKFKFKVIEKIIGVIKINKIDFLIVIDKSQPRLEIGGKIISIIKNIKIWNIKIWNFEDKENLRESLPRIEGIKRLWEKSFYFSEEYELFKNLNSQINVKNHENIKTFKNEDDDDDNNQDISKDDPKKNEGVILSINFKQNKIENEKQNIKYDEFNEGLSQNVNIEEDIENKTDFSDYYEKILKEDEFKYTWNINSLSFFKNAKVSTHWFCYIIQGYMKCIFGKLYEDDLQFDNIIISKRSYKRGGTRYNCRGVNKDGYTSNFVDTEAIIIYKDKVYSMNQYRGSIPFFWKQKPGNNFLKIDEDDNKNNTIFIKHYEMLKEQYKYIASINLLTDKKEDELKLTEYFLKYHKDIENDKILIQNFDYHKNHKNGDFTILNNHLMQNFKEIMNNKENYPFNIIEENKNIKMKQNSIVRTNCLDCWDRTNAYQTKISLYLFAYFINDVIKIDNIDSIYDELLKISDNQEKNTCNFLVGKNPLYFLNFMKKFSNSWADNGDEISFAYTGTGATTSMVTRQGKKNIKSMLDHGFKTISRFYYNVFEDDEKQKDIDSFLNKNKIFKKDTINNVRIKTITYCLKGNKLNQFSLESWVKNLVSDINYNLLNISYQRSENDTYQLEIGNNNKIIYKDFFDLIIYVIKEINERYNKNFKVAFHDKSGQSGIVILSNDKEFNFKIIQRMKKLNNFYEFGIYIVNVLFSYNGIYISLYNFDFGSKISWETKMSKIKSLIQKVNQEKNNYFCIFSGLFNFKIKYQNLYLKNEGLKIIDNLQLKKLNNEDIAILSQFDEFKGFSKNILLEGLLNFYPSSIYKSNSNLYIEDKSIPPNWSDRILYYYNNKSMNVLNNILNILDYNIIEDFDKGPYKGVYSVIEIEY